MRKQEPRAGKRGGVRGNERRLRHMTAESVPGRKEKTGGGEVVESTDVGRRRQQQGKDSLSLSSGGGGSDHERRAQGREGGREGESSFFHSSRAS